MDENGFQRRILGSLPAVLSSAAKRITPTQPQSLGGMGKLMQRLRAAMLSGWNWLRGKKQQLGWRRFIVRGIGISFGLIFLYLFVLWLTLPDLDDPASLLAAQSTIITDRNGKELYRLYAEEDRTFIPGEEIPLHMRQAIVAVEDERFYERGCLDLRALARVVFRLGQAGGASTLTRQLARNALNLKRNNIVNRKLKELILGCQLEWTYEKEDILNLYLNWIPFGQNAYGLQQASQRYFGISASGLTLAQSAVLAALPQRPSYFNPYGRHLHTEVTDDIREKVNAGEITTTEQIPDSAITIGLLGTHIGSGTTTVTIGGRTDQVLRNMRDQGFITEEEETKALAELKTIAFQTTRESIKAPHFVLWVKEQAEEMYHDSAETGLLEQGGLTIETTLDLDIQQAAEKAIAAKRESIAKVYGAENIALVAMDPVTREILAYVGNSDYSDEVHGGKIDMVQIPRQPGSSFKPFVYAAAFTKGYGPATVLLDSKTKFGPDEPQNFDGDFWGAMTIRKALGASRNIPAIKAFFLAGGERPVLEMAAALGAKTPLEQKEAGRVSEYGYPLAIGAGETPLMEMVHAYSTFAAQGMWKPYTAIRSIKDQRGALLPLPEPEPEREVLDPRIAYQITSILSDVSARPNDFWKSVLSVAGLPTAAKTGTSNQPCPEEDEKKGTCKIKPNNLWTIGYTPRLVAGVWVGNADSSAMAPAAESLSIAAPLWKDFMDRAHKFRTDGPSSFAVPPGLVNAQISLLSGQLPTDCTPVENRSSDIFLSEHAPTEPDPACATLEIDKVTGLLASESCPEDARETRSFFVPKSLPADRWANWDEMAKAGTGAGLPLPLAPTEECDISLTPGRLEKPTVRFLSPTSGGSVTYPSFHVEVATSGAPVRELLFAIDGKKVTSQKLSDTEAIIRIPQSIEQRGSHRLEVTLVDEYYNRATDTVTVDFREDTDGPAVRILSPRDGTIFSQAADLAVESQAEDRDGGVKVIEYYLDDLLLARKLPESSSFRYPLTDVKPGRYRLRAVATDLAGNTGEDEINITVEGL